MRILDKESLELDQRTVVPSMRSWVGERDGGMKLVRAYTFCFLALVAACGFSGCATTSSYEQQMRAQQEEEKRKADWEQMNWAQKTGSYVVYFIMEALAGLGSSGASFQP